jgi:HSP20 family protein
MTLVRWKPTRDLFDLGNEMTRFMDNFFNIPGRYTGDLDNTQWAPRVDVEEDKDGYTVTAELPGMDKKDIDIDVKDNRLYIKGEKKVEKDKDEKNYHITERCYGKFARNFTLPDNVNQDDIKAKFNNNGILTVEIPKIEEEKPKEIKIKVD